MRSFLHRSVVVFILTILTFSSLRMEGAAGDTTVVRGFVNLLHQNCNTGRGTFLFPPDSISYYKIMLKYQLSCPPFGCDIYDRIATLKVLKPTGTYDSTFTLAPSYRINNQIVDSFAYMNDTSYSYSWNSNTNQIDSAANPSRTVVFYSDTANPLVPTDTLILWPAFYNQYTFVNGVATDSVLVTPDGYLSVNIDTIYNVFEVTEPFEIARAITPYGMAVTVWFDVTDYRSLLADSVTLYSRVCGYSNGWHVTTDFYFIEGEPPIHAYKVENLWNGTWQYGRVNDPIDNHLQPITLQRDTQSIKEMVRLITTGHGFGGNPNQLVAEFSEFTHTLRINSTNLPQHLWRGDCGRNPLYPQGAPGYTSTWFYNRANWCPGSYVTPHDYDATPFTSPGGSYTVDYNMLPYTCTGGPSGFYWPEYYIQSQKFSYDRTGYQNNVAILEVRKPNNAFEYNRINPICPGIEPEIVIKNYGTDPLTSLVIHYGIDGVMNTYNWTGSLDFLDTATVFLPGLPFSVGTHTFDVELDQPNGSTDEFVYDNNMRTTFSPTTSYNSNFIRIMVKTDNSPGEISWEVKDNAGNMIATRSFFPVRNTTYIDTVYLANGCYNATVYDAGGDGLCCYNGNGFFRILKGGTATIIATKGDYGELFSVNFTIDAPSSIEDLTSDDQLFVYPNPAAGFIKLNTSFETAEMTGELLDLSGRRAGEVFNVSVNEYQSRVELPKVPAGMYLMVLTDKTRKLIKRIAVSAQE